MRPTHWPRLSEVPTLGLDVFYGLTAMGIVVGFSVYDWVVRRIGA